MVWQPWISVSSMMTGKLVGQELLWLEDPIAGGSLYELLAQKFAKAYDLRLAPTAGKSALSALLASHPASKAKTHEAYDDLRDIYERAEFGIPKALLRLWEIHPLRIFVTTTFDNSLE